MNERLGDHHVVDLLAVLIASAIVLAGWQSTYAGNGWWIAGAGAAVLALMVAIVARDAGLGAEIVFLVLLVGYLVVAGPLASGSLAFEGWATVTGGLTGTGDGFRTLLTTHPPVTAEGPVLLPPVVGGLVTAGLGASVAMSTSRPAAPLLPVAVVFVSVLLMGQHETISAPVLGAGTGVLMLLWLRTRTQRLEGERLSSGSTARSLGGVVLVVLAGALTAVLVVGGDSGAGRYLARDSADPYTVAAVRTPLDDFRQFTLQDPGAQDNVYDAKLFQVEGLESGSRLRFAALDTYHGQRLSADNNTVPARFDDRFLHVSTTVRNPAAGEVEVVRISTTDNWQRTWVPTIGAVQEFDFAPGGARGNSELRSQLRYDPATGTALLPDGLDGGVSYEIRTRTNDLLADRSMTESSDLDLGLYRDLAVLDPVIGYFKGGAYTPMDAVFKVAAGLRKVGLFSDGAGIDAGGVRSGHDLRRLADGFLLATPTVGDEEQYAASMALLATRMGVPARVVVGAIVPDSGTVRGKDVTAWVEVRIDDGTWRTIPTDTFMSRRPFQNVGTGVPSVRDYLGEREEERTQEQRDQSEKRAERRDEADRTDDGGRRWSLVLLVAVLALIVGVLLGAASVPLAKWRRRRRRERATRPSTRMAGAWEELVDRARDLGVDVPRASRPVQAEALDRGRSLAREADRRIYSVDELSESEVTAFWELVHSELRELDGAATRWRRVRARMSPVSLRRRH